MASTSTQIASSSSTPRWKYDVLLSCGGRDSRTGVSAFLSLLYQALRQKGIKTFRDNEPVRAREIPPKIAEAIQESQYAVVVLTREYAFSEWCLEMLVKIMKCKRETKLTVLPVFYHVDRSDVRHQKADFTRAFRYHSDWGVDSQEMNAWRAALTEIGAITGWHLADKLESSEAEVVEAICKKISDGLTQTSQ